MKTYYIAQGNCSVLCGGLKGRKSKKERGYVQLTHFAVQQNLIQHCKATFPIKLIKNKWLKGK